MTLPPTSWGSHFSKTWLVSLLFLAMQSCHCGGAPNDSIGKPDTIWKEGELSELAKFIAKTWSSSGTDNADSTPDSPSALEFEIEAAYIVARSGGKELAQVWSRGDTAASAIASGIRELRAKLLANWKRVDSLDLFLSLSSESVDPLGQRQELFSNHNRGVLGLAIEHEGARTLYSPTYSIATNRRNERLVELFGAENELTEGVLRSLKYWFLHGPQFLLKLADIPTATQMVRGNTLVPIDAVDKNQVLLFADRMALWMWKNLHTDGRMTYLLWPHLGQESSEQHSPVRQLNATLALEEISAVSNNQEYQKRSADNIQYNLATYYRKDGQFGQVLSRGKVSLEATALMALAIVKHPQRAQWLDQELALRRTIVRMWQEDGSFQTRQYSEKHSNSDYASPGNALFLWAHLYLESPNEKLRRRFMKSFEYYRNWHLATETIEYEFDEVDGGLPRPTTRPIPGRRKPTFIPRHSQAYALMWQATKDERLLEFVFTMNDWLVEFQDWPVELDGEMEERSGRFYSPKRGFGPPSSASTGQYLESLISAFGVANASFDGQRQGMYAQALRRGLRHLMQLQFVDDVDLFYVLDRSRALGGLRTSVYDNQIRCDNVQHSLMATLKILRSDILSP